MFRLTMRDVLCLSALQSLLFSPTSWADPPGDVVKSVVTWEFQRLDAVGGHSVTLVGSPRLIDTPEGKAVEFDGKGDAIFLESNSLAGLKEFSAEVIFRPYA